MRKVVSKHEVARLWYNQSQDEARVSGGNFYFHGPTIYSYGSHFPIAKHVTGKDGQRGILFTDKTYSNTTAKHIGHVWRVVGSGEVIECNQIPSSEYEFSWVHGKNFAHWEYEALQAAAKLLKARKPSIYLDKIDRIKRVAARYAEFFGIDTPTSLANVLSIGTKQDYAAYLVTQELIKSNS